MVTACEAVAAPMEPDEQVRRSPAEALATARRLDQGGDWEAAAQAYGEALVDGGAAGATARFELARLLHRLGNHQAAADTLAPLLAQPPVSETGVHAWFLSGAVQDDLGDAEGAVAAYARYVELGGAAAAYARVEQGRLLAGIDADRALAALGPLLAGAGPAHARRLALRQAGGIEESAGRPDRALADYEALNGLTTWNSERILALSRIGAMRQQLGDLDGAAEAWGTLAARYPTAAEAETALARLDEIGRPADPLTAGIVHYRRRNNQQARDVLNGYLRANGMAGPGAATALFYLGALAERRDDTAMALEDYQQAYDADPAGALAVEALWERAGVLEGAGRAEEARGAYTLVADRFPGSRRAPDAAFRAGYLAYTRGNAAAARAAWGAGMSAQDGAAAARAAFWTGRAAGDLGDGNAARLAYGEAVRRDPAGYYGLRAAALLAGEPGAPSSAGSGTLALAPPDWAQAENWLAGWAGAEDPRAWQSVSTSEDWRAGRELLELGWLKTGIDGIELVVGGRTDQPWPLYHMARELSAAGYPHLAYIAAASLLARAPAGAPPAAVALAQLAYPAPWADEARYFAAQYGVDPLLLYAMMRQESAFNPVAGSSAGAFGLTQVIAPTAQEIARALGKSPFDFGDLARPNVAIQFGAYYLAGQLRAFKGNVYQALAAYNGGAGNAARWARPGGPADVDRFYEEVDYTETKLYLRLVLQNYAWYRYLYGVTTRPSLTSPGR